VSNFPYELWINCKFVGSGGYRCTDTEMYIDNWSDLLITDTIVIRYQWFNSNTINLWYRRIFPMALFVDMIDSPSLSLWTLSVDTTVEFGDKICAHLPHQNIISKTQDDTINPNNLTLKILDNCPYIIKPLPVNHCEYIDVIPKLISQNDLASIHPNFAKISSKIWPDYQNYEYKCDTYDLGYIALHRFEVDTTEYGVVMYYGEISKFEDLFTTKSRLGVKLADAVNKNIQCGAPVGTRGCRYVNVIYPVTSEYNCNITLRVQRYQYPFEWLDVTDKIAPECDKIMDACKNNLIACVDGGVVDTCWRERSQWTGDARISSLALKTLTANTEVIEFVLDQISQSYDCVTGMVQGAYPIKKPNRNCEIPTYHLAFCYNVIEYYGCDYESCSKIRAYDVMMQSLVFWKHKYLNDGILAGMPGWYFLDWDKEEILVTDNERVGYKYPHSVCNAMFYDICNTLNIDSGINMDTFNNLFCWKNYAYTINPNSHPNLHATSLILSLKSFANINIGKQYLIDVIDDEFDLIKSKVTPYFAFYIAKALQIHYPDQMIPFIKKYYDPIVNKYGTIYEKINPTGSMAHGWSIGIASLIIKK